MQMADVILVAVNYRSVHGLKDFFGHVGCVCHGLAKAASGCHLLINL